MLTLRRMPEYFDTTPGNFFYYDRLICSCLELPWQDNTPYISCIPPGQYKIAFTWSPKLQRYAIEILKVPGRTGIRIHPANVINELRGCLAPCVDIILEEYRLFGRSSKIAVDELEKLVKDKGIGMITVL